MEMIEKHVHVYLTDAECRLKGMRLAQVRRERAANEQQRKAWMASFKEKDETLATEEAELVEVNESGRELRPITCMCLPNYERGVMEFVREDMVDENGHFPPEAIVEARPLTTSEKQTRLLLPPPKKPSEPIVGEPDPAPAPAPAPELPKEARWHVTVKVPQREPFKAYDLPLPHDVSDLAMGGESCTVMLQHREGGYEAWTMQLGGVERAGIAQGHTIDINLVRVGEDKHGPYKKLQPVKVSAVRRDQPAADATAPAPENPATAETQPPPAEEPKDAPPAAEEGGAT